jgi:hypothetical protein
MECLDGNHNLRILLKTQMIVDLINHDEVSNNVFLFYRKNRTDEYTYIGLLKYLNHDEESGSDKEPVNFNWQLMNWPIENETMVDLEIKLEPGLDYNRK